MIQNIVIIVCWFLMIALILFRFVKITRKNKFFLSIIDLGYLIVLLFKGENFLKKYKEQCELLEAGIFKSPLFKISQKIVEIKLKKK